MDSNLEQLSRDPNASASRSFFMLFLPSLIFIELLFLGEWNAQEEFGVLAVAGIFAPIVALFLTLTISLFIYGTHLVGKWFGGNGSYVKLYYANAAYYILSLVIASAITIFLPFNYVKNIFGIYFLAINIFIVTKLHHLGGFKAMVSAISGALLVGIFFAGLVVIVQAFSLFSAYRQEHPVISSVPVESLSECMKIEILKCDWDVQGRLTNNCGQTFESVKIKAIGSLSKSGSKVENEREYFSFGDNHDWTFLIRLKPYADEQVMNCEVIIEAATKVK